jgi:hypothetical protein
MQNVGWLGEGHPIPQGKCHEDLVPALTELALAPVRLMRGVHHCDFCDQKSPLAARSKLSDSIAWLGNGEILVCGGNDIFVAPTLIVHYVAVHAYCPPDVFVAAVLEWWGGGANARQG